MRRKLQLLRNIFVLAFAAIVGPSVYPRFNEEPVFILIFAISAGLAILTAIDLALMAARLKNRAYFYLNSIIQLVPSFILAGMFPPGGLPLLLLNIAVIIMLKRERREIKSKPKK
jgi:hypothetical protein